MRDAVGAIALPGSYASMFKHVAVLIAALLSLASPVQADELVGKAQAISGDTLVVGGHRVRLFGIDAPEEGETCMRQRKRLDCGREASFALAFETAEHWVRCQPHRQEAGALVAELVAVCFVGPYDLAEIMVSKGWAQASDVRYARAQEDAKTKRMGIWAGR
jgi:endonuclease YncB( thermonuclease family)